MKQICECCKQEFEDWQMKYYSPIPGRPKWYCWDCYKNSQREATKSDVFRQKKLYKMHEGKKGNK